MLKAILKISIQLLNFLRPKKSCCKVLALIFLSYGSANSQTLTFAQIADSIRINNPMLKMFDAQSAAYTNYADGTKSWMPPQIGAGLFMTPYNVGMWKSDNMGNKGMGSMMLQAEQMIPNYSKLNAEKNYMQSMSNMEAANKGITLNQLLFDAKTNFYQWQVLLKKSLIIQENISLLQYLKKSVEIRYKYGSQNSSTIYKTEAMIAEDSSMLIMLQGMMIEKNIMLNALMNRKTNTLFIVDTTMQISNSYTGNIDTASLQSNLSVFKLFDAQSNTLKLKQNFEKSKLKPEFGVQYAHMYTFGNQPQLYTLMGMMKLPIAPWSSKMSKFSIKAINNEIQAIEWQKQALLIEKTGALQGIASQIQYKKQQIKNYHSAVIPALNKNYRTSLLAFEQNTGDLLSVQDALMSLKTAQLQEIDLYNDLLLLQAQYEKELEKY